MFVYNLKVNGKSMVKTVFVIISIIITIFFIYSTYKIVSESFKVKDENNSMDVQVLNTGSYTNVLNSVHNNLNDYIGKKFSFSGYVYRLSDFDSNQFVLARDMIISDNSQTLIVGFLCSSKDAGSFADGDWVELTGEITKGDYHGEIPIIKVSKIRKIDVPNEDVFVYPPDDSYVPTSAVF